ncbi:hypothetical protein EZS27_001831 [termite gut metagenome]|uniref:DUF4861 domain-containing protein n=1 Tax=termite gut metagenome TaxID=433724 RepID=A0A5J4SZP2_9ZZZZ
MKRILYLCLIAFIAVSCNGTKILTVTVTNSSDLARADELIELSVESVSGILTLKPADKFVITDTAGIEIPYQITYDNKVIFPVNVASAGVATYTIAKGIPAEVAPVTFGKQYPERVDDIAWENDLVAFRTYGPALQATGEKAFGYDIWNKNVKNLVVEARYAKELNPETIAKIAELKKKDPKAATALRKEVSYHVDHGDGMDCYKVGPTLGGGTSALIVDDAIIYPYCYKAYEILDNGPLRFTVKLVYNPLVVKADTSVVETRIVSLDAGSYLNKTTVSYEGLSEETPLAVGIVLHEPNGETVADAEAGYITYIDPTEDPKNDNGKIFVGAAFPSKVKEAKVALFSKQEKQERGADGHILAISDYKSGDYTYYWGGVWSKSNIQDLAAWNQYVSEFALKAANPLAVEVK